jgi:hypothetical protein
MHEIDERLSDEFASLRTEVVCEDGIEVDEVKARIE